MNHAVRKNYGRFLDIGSNIDFFLVLCVRIDEIVVFERYEYYLDTGFPSLI